MSSFQKNFLLFTLPLIVLILGVHYKSILAHERVEIGPYVVIVGWVNEPAIVGERNALFLEITESEEPVVGVEATLDAELIYAGRAFRSNLNPSTVPGQYTVEIFPTVRGQYSVRLFGAIGETEVEEIVEPEEVFSADRIQFPEPEPSIRDLQRDTEQKLNELSAQLQMAQLIAFLGVGIGLIGTVLAVWDIRRKQ